MLGFVAYTGSAMSRRTLAVVGVLGLVLLLPGAVQAAPAPKSPAPKSDDPCAVIPDVPGLDVAPKATCKGARDVAKGVGRAAKGADEVAKDVAEKGPVGAVADAAGDQVGLDPLAVDTSGRLIS